MLPTSFLVMYRIRGVFGPGRLVGLLHERNGLTEQFPSLTFPPTSTMELWGEKKKTFNGDDKKAF